MMIKINGERIQTENQEPNLISKISKEYYQIHKDLKTFTDLYKLQLIFDYSKIELINSKLLDKVYEKNHYIFKTK